VNLPPSWSESLKFAAAVPGAGRAWITKSTVVWVAPTPSDLACESLIGPIQVSSTEDPGWSVDDGLTIMPTVAAIVPAWSV
jgi:hypothetical protein